MNDSTSMFSVHALPNRAARRFALSRRRQRKAQALILAVLVMLMVAVLSAGFLLVVSGNLNQTARVTDKTRAVESARSGLKFVNEQLTYSQLGENWRPGFVAANRSNLTLAEQLQLAQGESIMPQMNDGIGDYSLYYSQVDIANNWAGRFAKFPDPLAPRSDAPQYLARVERVVSQTVDPNYGLPVGDPDLADPSKLGMLRITVIGLSNDDPAAFSKVVAYKGGQSSPFGRFMRTVTNWDFKNNVVPVAQIDPANASTATQLNLSAVQGNFPPVPFTVMVGNATTASTLRSAVVTAVSATNQLTLAQALSPVPSTTVKERVEVAAQLGASVPINSAPAITQSAIDFDNDSATPVTNTDLKVSQPAITGTAQSGSLFVNGSVIFKGDLMLPDLVPQTGTSPYSSTIRVSSLMLRNATQKVLVGIPDGSNTGGQKGIDGSATADVLVPDSSADHLLENASAMPVPATTAETVVSDGFNRLNNDPSSLRQTKPMTPPDISSSAGAGRYRQLTRDSASTVAGASNYGYGAGIYINNPSDRERVYDTTSNKLRDMTQAELTRMWLSRKADGSDDKDAPVAGDTTTLTFRRSATADPVIATNASLEQQHLRGWVGPDEFHARGALVELFNDSTGAAKVAITLDSRDDNPTTTNGALGGVATKAWKKVTDGTPDTGVYRKVFDWPANGVIFGEGNIRVRGTATNAPYSLTIVSENNLYVDGSVGTTPATGKTAKLLLLARRNVVANPTSLVSRVEAVTTFKSALGTTATVADAGQFQAGDWIYFNASTSTLNASATSATKQIELTDIARVLSVDTTLNTLLLDRVVPASANVGSLVRAVADPLDASTTPDPNAKTVRMTWAKLGDFRQVIQRRLPPSTTPLRLAFMHSGEQRLAPLSPASPAPALSIQFNSRNPNKSQLTAKTPPTPASGDPAPVVVQQARKQLSIQQDDPAPDLFPLTDADLTTFAATSNSITPHGPPNPPWTYNFKVEPAGGYGGISPLALAGIGNRSSLEATPTVVTNPYQDLLGTGPNNKFLTVATSVNSYFGGGATPMPLGTDLWGKPIVQVANFGFAPNIAIDEDILTGDASFYVPDATGTNPQLFALDSRVLPANPLGDQTFSLTFPRTAVTNTPLMGFEPDPVNNAAATNKMPYYRLGALKVEDVQQQTDASGNVTFKGITPVGININAFVYAQQGSWFVIPALLFDKDAKNGSTIDNDRNGTPDVDAAVAAYRFARYNYQINFTGAIAENQTAIVNSIPGTPVVGAVQAWSDSWANVTTDTSTLQKQNAGVVYSFDPSYAAGQLANDPGFVMPQTEELTYVE